ncbi:MAG: phosphoribosylamine--glycine ligase [Clostridia bacterium]|nr:phosphoribosylamine--glycine ligase [Clostridia bacterium]
MDILVIGGGGREHAIVKKLSESERVGKIYCAPGNAGIAELAECVAISATDIDGVVNFVTQNPNIGLTVVAPDDPLSLGMVDALNAIGKRAFGPVKGAARIEASKAFAKDLMKKYGIPTAQYQTFSDYEAAKAYLSECRIPVVLKADGLALGKGVLICNTREEALEGIADMMQEKRFGSAGSTVVIEEFLTGREVSVLAFTDGKTVLPMLPSQDHKRAYDNDQGLNTGGMGTFCPSPYFTKEMQEECMRTIFQPTVDAMAKEGVPFKGVLYFGLMMTPDGVKVIEYNARFGDPETQVVLPLLTNDLLSVFEACIDGTLDTVTLEWKDAAAVCVIMASGGYPESYQKGYPITIGALEQNVVIYHAGTAFKDGKLVTAGGRVLGVTAIDSDLVSAREKAYRNLSAVSFEKAHYRTDIGKK